jgi:CRISPR-associated endoribonuclease Cas6
MQKNTLYSLMLELCALETTTLPTTTGHLTHAMFLDMVAQVKAPLATRLHNEQTYKPFTVSALLNAPRREGQLHVQVGMLYHVRITLLDGGEIWDCFTRRILEEHQLILRIGRGCFRVERLLSTPTNSLNDWAAHCSWQDLSREQPREMITLRFASPTAFSLGKRRFALFPEPVFVWDSLLRSWNRYAPEGLHIEKTALRTFIADRMTVRDYALHTGTLHFPNAPQTGFLGTCTYLLKKEPDQDGDEQNLFHITALAQFAQFAGVGYKTTMGMGQVRITEEEKVF